MKDPSGLLTPERAATLIPAILAGIGDLPLELHSHCTLGLSPRTSLRAVELGVRTVHVACGPLGNGTSLPELIGRLSPPYRSIPPSLAEWGVSPTGEFVYFDLKLCDVDLPPAPAMRDRIHTLVRPFEGCARSNECVILPRPDIALLESVRKAKCVVFSGGARLSHLSVYSHNLGYCCHFD